MSEQPPRLHYLIEKYISETLNEEEAREMLGMVEGQTDLLHYIRINCIADYWLSQKYKSCDSEEEEETKIEMTVPVSTDQINSFLTEMVDYERSAIAIRPELKTQPQISDKLAAKPRSVEDRKRNRQKEIRSFRWFLARFALFVLAITWLSYDGSRPKKQEEQNDPFIPVARISEMVDVVWANNAETFKKGQGTGINTIAIRSGMLKLEFENLAELILEGPAEFTIAGPLNTSCSYGKVSAHIPPNAVGFEIVTPLMNIVDRGTDFYLNVTQKMSQVGVVKGRVDVTHSDHSPIILKQGDAGQCDSNNVFTSLAVDSTQFITPDRLHAILAKQANKEQMQRKNAERVIVSDPNLDIRFRLYEHTPHAIENGALANQEVPSSGRMIGTQTTPGSIYGSKVVAFHNKNDYIEFDLPKKYRNLTLVTQVRIDRLRREGNGILSSSDFLTRSGSFLWQISYDGRLQIQITSNKEDGRSQKSRVFSSGKVLDPSIYGTWTKLAVTFDSVREKITWFADGKMISSVNWPDPEVLSPGLVLLGNVPQNQSQTNRVLTGAIEEFSVYNRALSPYEISKISTVVQ